MLYPIDHPTLRNIKSFLIVQTICQLSISYLTVHLLQQNILQQLNEDSKLMERWEPTIIINQVFPYNLLKVHVYIVTIAIIIASAALNIYSEVSGFYIQRRTPIDPIFYYVRPLSMIVDYLFMQGILFVCVLLLFILFGASPFEDVSHTILASWYFTLLVFGYHRPPPKKEHRLSFGSIIVHVLIGEDYCDGDFGRGGGGKDEDNTCNQEIESIINIGFILDRTSRCVMFTTLVATIPFQILHVLDHGAQIQRWPIPIILGSTVGHCLGVVVGLVVGWLTFFGVTNHKKAN